MIRADVLYVGFCRAKSFCSVTTRGDKMKDPLQDEGPHFENFRRRRRRKILGKSRFQVHSINLISFLKVHLPDVCEFVGSECNWLAAKPRLSEPSQENQYVNQQKYWTKERLNRVKHSHCYKVLPQRRGTVVLDSRKDHMPRAD